MRGDHHPFPDLADLFDFSRQSANNQPGVPIQLYGGEEQFIKGTKLLAKFQLDGILPAPRGVTGKQKKMMKFLNLKTLIAKYLIVVLHILKKNMNI